MSSSIPSTNASATSQRLAPPHMVKEELGKYQRGSNYHVQLLSLLTTYNCRPQLEKLCTFEIGQQMVFDVLVGAASRNFDIFSQLLEQGVDLNAVQNQRADTVLISVCGDRCTLKVIEMLLDYGSNINAVNKFGVSALMNAVSKGRESIVAELLQRGADVTLKNTKGQDALIMACRNNRISSLGLLIAHGGDVNTLEDANGNTALIVASSLLFADIVSQLIEGGADVNARNHDGDTALLAMCSSNSMTSYSAMDVLKVLVKSDVDIDAQDKTGNTALMKLSQRGYFELVNILLAHSANANILNDAGKSAADVACSKKIQKKIQEYETSQDYLLK